MGPTSKGGEGMGRRRREGRKEPYSLPENAGRGGEG